MARALTDLTRKNWLEERRERRQLRRAKQRENNIRRAGKMHKVRLKIVAEEQKTSSHLKRSEYVRLFGLALLEMARLLLCGRAPGQMVRALFSHLSHRRNQRFVLLVADRCKRPGLAATVRRHSEISQSKFHRIPAGGHLIHQTGTRQVMSAIHEAESSVQSAFARQTDRKGPGVAGALLLSASPEALEKKASVRVNQNLVTLLSSLKNRGRGEPIQ